MRETYNRRPDMFTTVTFFSDFLAILRLRNRDLKATYWFFISVSKILGKVAVTVGSLDGSWNSPDETEFEYHSNIIQDLQELINKTLHTKRNIPLDNHTLNPSRSARTGQNLCFLTCVQHMPSYFVTTIIWLTSRSRLS